jgi:hypothetical protein
MVGGGKRGGEVAVGAHVDTRRRWRTAARETRTGKTKGDVSPPRNFHEHSPNYHIYAFTSRLSMCIVDVFDSAD